MSIMSYINEGGVIIYILIFLNFIGYSLILYKCITIFLLYKDSGNIFKNIKNDIGTLSEIKYISADQVIKNSIEKYMIKLDLGLDTIKVISSISPLLGLLGTVIGIFSSFLAISKSGMGDPSIFSNGISLALITTIAGLIVAIPHYIAYNYIISYLEKFEINMESRLVLFYEKKKK